MNKRPLFFIFIILTLILCSSSANATKTTVYDGSEKFISASGWTKVSDGSPDGIFETITDNTNWINTTDADNWQYRYVPGLNATTGYIVDIRTKIESDSTHFNVGIYDSTYGVWIRILPTTVSLAGASVSTGDNTDDFHVFSFARNGTQLYTYRDYVEIDNRTLSTASAFDRLDVYDGSAVAKANVTLDWMRITDVYGIPDSSEPDGDAPTTPQIYHVDNSIGSDSNDGLYNNASHAWATIQHAVDNINDNDTVYVYGGGDDYDYFQITTGTNTTFRGINSPNVRANSTGTINGTIVLGEHLVAGDIDDIEISGFNIYQDATGEAKLCGILINADSLVNNYNISNNDIRTEFGYGIYNNVGSGSNSTIQNNIVESGDRAAIFFDWLNTHDRIHDVSIINNTINASYHNTYGTSASGIHIYGGSAAITGFKDYLTYNFNVSNNHIIHSGYTGIKIIETNFVTIDSNIVYPDGYLHNAFEFGQDNVTNSNNIVLGSNTTALATIGGASGHLNYGAGSVFHSNITVINFAAYNNTEDVALLLGGQLSNVLIKNYYLANHSGNAIYVSGGFPTDDFAKATSNNTVIHNFTGVINSAVNPITITNIGSDRGDMDDWQNFTRDIITLIDINITGSYNSTKSTWWITDNTGDINKNHNGSIYAINCNRNDTTWDQNYGNFSTTIDFMYYPNIRVINSTGYVVDNALVNFTTSSINPETGAVLSAKNINYVNAAKGYVDDINETYTTLTGYIPLPTENASGCIALAAYSENKSTTNFATWTVTASKLGETDTDTIYPHMLIYSPNSSDIQSELVTLILDVPGESLLDFEISSFTPADTTPSSVNGTGQTFTVNLSASGNVTWLINGSVFQTNTSVTNATYFNSTAPAGIYNVAASATDGSTNVTQTWTWTVTEVPVTPTTVSGWDSQNSATEYILLFGAFSSAVMLLIISMFFPSTATRIKSVLQTKEAIILGFTVVIMFMIAYVMSAIIDNIL